MERWWCWAFRLHGRKQVLDTSNVLAEGRSTPRAFLFFLCEDSRKSPRLNSRVNMFLPDAISGMRECFSGAYQLSWAAVHELLARKSGENVSAGRHVALDAHGNFLWSPKKFVAAIGIRDLIVVETEDALLLCPRDRAQEVGKIVKWLEDEKRSPLL